jgi:hypothetical protein
VDGPDQPEAARAGAVERDRLLATKLHVPQPRLGFVPRPRLLERLAEGTAHELVLVSAPAGFGKTALLGDWARRGRRPVAWLSLDEGDNDPVRFWRHAAAALDRVRPGIAERVAPLLGPPKAPSLEGVVTTLINELAGQPGEGEVLLVLDDYDRIQVRPVHVSVTFLLSHLPPQLRLVVASRADPPLPLARLRARGQLAELRAAELRAAELRFTAEEAAALLQGMVGPDQPLSDAAVAALATRTEGWAAGLQLAALSLPGQPDPAGFVASFSGSHRFVLDYLTEEVLERQPGPVRTFLLETSVLTRLCGALCDVVTGRGDGQRRLEEIERANLFLVPLDEVRGWWRHHHLFADLLRARLDREQPERVPQLHRAAAAWFQDQGLVEEAIHHALAAGDADWAARLVEDHFSRLLWRSEEVTVDRWLAALPPAVVSARPWLCLALAARAGLAGRLEEVEPLLEAAERAHAAGGAPVPAGRLAGVTTSLTDDVPTMVAMVRANLARTYGDAGPATRLGERSVASLAGRQRDRARHAVLGPGPGRLAGRAAGAGRGRPQLGHRGVPGGRGAGPGRRHLLRAGPGAAGTGPPGGCAGHLPRGAGGRRRHPSRPAPGGGGSCPHGRCPARTEPAGRRDRPCDKGHRAVPAARLRLAAGGRTRDPGLDPARTRRPGRRPPDHGRGRAGPARPEAGRAVQPGADTGGMAGAGPGTDRRRRPLGPGPRAGKRRCAQLPAGARASRPGPAAGRRTERRSGVGAAGAIACGSRRPATHRQRARGPGGAGARPGVQRRGGRRAGRLGQGAGIGLGPGLSPRLRRRGPTDGLVARQAHRNPKADRRRPGPVPRSTPGGLRPGR